MSFIFNEQSSGDDTTVNFAPLPLKLNTESDEKSVEHDVRAMRSTSSGGSWRVWSLNIIMEDPNKKGNSIEFTFSADELDSMKFEGLPDQVKQVVTEGYESLKPKHKGLLDLSNAYASYWKKRSTKRAIRNWSFDKISDHIKFDHKEYDLLIRDWEVKQKTEPKELSPNQKLQFEREENKRKRYELECKKLEAKEKVRKSKEKHMLRGKQMSDFKHKLQKKLTSKDFNELNIVQVGTLFDRWHDGDLKTGPFSGVIQAAKKLIETRKNHIKEKMGHKTLEDTERFLDNGRHDMKVFGSQGYEKRRDVQFPRMDNLHELYGGRSGIQSYKPGYDYKSQNTKNENFKIESSRSCIEREHNWSSYYTPFEHKPQDNYDHVYYAPYTKPKLGAYEMWRREQDRKAFERYQREQERLNQRKLRDKSPSRSRSNHENNVNDIQLPPQDD